MNVLSRGPSAYSPGGKGCEWRAKKLERRHCRTQPASLPDLDLMCLDTSTMQGRAAARVGTSTRVRAEQALAFCLEPAGGAASVK